MIAWFGKLDISILENGFGEWKNDDDKRGDIRKLRENKEKNKAAQE